MTAQDAPKPDQWKPHPFGEVQGNRFRHVGVLSGGPDDVGVEIQGDPSKFVSPYYGERNYRPFFGNPGSFTDRIAKYTSSRLAQATNAGPLSAALTWGLLGAGAGLLGSHGYAAAQRTFGKDRDAEGLGWKGTLAAGLAAAALGAYAGTNRVPAAQYQAKAAAALTYGGPGQTASAREALIAALYAEHGIPLQQKAVIEQAIRSLGSAELDAVLRRVGSLGGFGVGALLAKLFLGTGFGGSVLGGLAGAFILPNLLSPRKLDATGRQYH